ncbi:hypothetical protein BD769DRAFT_15402 [Suillus cothurnatus]|nr:hypothetical protein BD769DRAFT_15402 [Suillus cothurnatus]
MVPAAAVSYVLCFILMTIFITAHRAIAACRVFIRLDAYNKGNGEKAHNNPSLVNHNSTSPSVSPRGPTSSSDPVSFLPLPSPKTTNPGICATMGSMDLSGASQSARSKSLTSATATVLRSTPSQTPSILVLTVTGV